MPYGQDKRLTIEFTGSDAIELIHGPSLGNETWRKNHYDVLGISQSVVNAAANIIAHLQLILIVPYLKAFGCQDLCQFSNHGILVFRGVRNKEIPLLAWSLLSRRRALRGHLCQLRIYTCLNA